MAQVITLAGEKLFATKAQANQQLDIDTFIFANVAGQDPAAAIDRNEGIPTSAIVHQQNVQQTGRINDNVVVYSTVLDSVTGPFEFNWVGLYSSVNQTLVAISHVPTVSKTITAPGSAGNTLNRNFGIEYSGIADLAGISVSPETWQLDFSARLSGMDELTRQLASDMNGKDWFIDDGFKVVPRSTANTFSVTPGIGYVSGLRVELKQEHILTLQTYPQFVYVDAYFDGNASSQWKPQVAFTVSNTEMDDYIDVNGVQHYVFKMANITAANVVEDLRNEDGLAQKIGNIELKIQEIVSLKDYGATGDGITDDTIAWNKWKSAGGNFIPAGEYLVDGVVKKYLMPTYGLPEKNNHAIGFEAFESNTEGYNNTATGFRSLQKNTSGFDNVAIGVQAMRENTTGNRNTAVGVDALAKNTTGDHNLAFGQNALGFNATGTYNTALGIDALEYGTNNHFNTAIGQYAALNLENSNNNTVIGYNTFQAATSGNGNVALGFDTLRDQDGVTGSTAIGTEAARGNTTGTHITAIGYRAARTNTVGTHITAISDQAAFKNLDGTHNIAVGFTALYRNVSGSYNCALGDNALFLTTADNNVGIGGFAGYNVTTGSQNTFIGHGAGFTGLQKADAVNTTAIGRGAFTTKDNTVQLGNSDVVGVGVGANKIEWLIAKPTTGTWNKGSVVWNLAVIPGGVPGWICVAAGTPGTWKAMANIEA